MFRIGSSQEPILFSINRAMRNARTASGVSLTARTGMEGTESVSRIVKQPDRPGGTGHDES